MARILYDDAGRSAAVCIDEIDPLNTMTVYYATPPINGVRATKTMLVHTVTAHARFEHASKLFRISATVSAFPINHVAQRVVRIEKVDAFDPDVFVGRLIRETNKSGEPQETRFVIDFEEENAPQYAFAVILLDAVPGDGDRRGPVATAVRVRYFK